MRSCQCGTSACLGAEKLRPGFVCVRRVGFEAIGSGRVDDAALRALIVEARRRVPYGDDDWEWLLTSLQALLEGRSS